MDLFWVCFEHLNFFRGSGIDTRGFVNYIADL